MRRPQDPTDNATPSGWSAAAGALLAYAALTGSARHRAAAEGALGVYAPAGRARAVRRLGAGGRRGAARRSARGRGRRAAAGDPATAALHASRCAAPHPVPRSRWATRRAPTGVPLLADRPLVGGRPAAYVCRHFTCDAPTTEPARLAEALGARI